MSTLKKYAGMLPGLIKKIKKQGFFHVLLGNTLIKIISFASALLLPNILTKTDYGTLGSVDTFINYILLVNGIGLSNAVLRFCSVTDDQKEKKAVFRFAMKWGMIIDGILISVLIPVFLIVPLSIESARTPLFFAIILPLFSFVFDTVTYYLRANYMNRAFSYVSIIFTVISVCGQILLSLKFGIFGAFSGRYLAYGGAAIVTFFVIKKYLSPKEGIFESSFILDSKKKKAILMFALGAMVANAFSLIMPQNEIFVISEILKSEEAVADYKVASILPQNIQFITSSIIIFIYPYFARHSHDGKWIWQKYKQMTILLIIVFAVMCAVLIPMTPFILRIFGWEEKYRGVVGLMQFMWITFSVNAAVRMPAGNILAAIGEIKFNLIVAIITSVIHLALDVFFVTKMGINGAVYALTIAYILSGIISSVFLKIKCNRIQKNPPEEVKK